jgi:hypothetical protein
MKQLNRLTLFIFVLGFVFYIIFRFFFSKLLGASIEYGELFLVGATLSLAYSLSSYYLIGLTFKPKLRFLESNETVTPAFGNKIDKTFQVKDEEFSIEALKLKLENTKYITTFFDKEKKMLKFRSHFSINYPASVGGSIVYDKESHLMNFSCFPFYGYTEQAVKRTQKAVGQIEKIIQTA